MAVGHLTNLLSQTVRTYFPLGKFLLYPFPLPLIEPENHGYSWYFTCRASEWGFIIGQHEIETSIVAENNVGLKCYLPHEKSLGKL